MNFSLKNFKDILKKIKNLKNYILKKTNYLALTLLIKILI